MSLQALQQIIIIQVQDLDSSEEFIRKIAVRPQQNLNQVLLPINRNLSLCFHQGSYQLFYLPNLLMKCQVAASKRGLSDTRRVFLQNLITQMTTTASSFELVLVFWQH